MQYKIQHLKLGGVLDQAIGVIRDNLKLLLGIFLYAWIPFQLIVGGIQLATLPQGGASPEALAATLDAQSEFWMVTFGFTVIGILLIFPVTNAAVIYAVAERYLGREVSAGSALRRGVGKLGSLIWTSILWYLAIMGGFILFIIPGILFSLWFGLAHHVVVLEDLSGIDALSRSKKLVRGHLGTFIVLGLIVFIISAMLQSGTALIPQIHLRMFCTIVVNAVTTLFSTAALVVFYFSCRCDVENFDLEFLAANVDSTSAGPAAEPAALESEI